MPAGVMTTGLQLALSYPIAKIKGSRCIIVAAANLVPMTCAILLWKLPRSNKGGLLVAYLFFATGFATYALTTSLPMANTSGHTKKVTMNAFWFISYALGNILGRLSIRLLFSLLIISQARKCSVQAMLRTTTVTATSVFLPATLLLPSPSLPTARSA